MKTGNLCVGIPEKLPDELVTKLVAHGPLRIERIVSRGHVSPPGQWYDQDEHEYVLLVQGRARLEFEGARMVDLHPGDWIDIPAHLRHRVDFTDPSVETIWLAVFYGV